MITLAMYDIENDKLRRKVIEILLDYGLNRIQYSVFSGELNRNMRESMTLEINRLVNNENKKYDIQIMIVEEDNYQKRVKILEGV